TDLVRLAAGAPGRLLAETELAEAMTRARQILDAAASNDRALPFQVALGQGFSGARGRFTDTLDALVALLHDRAERAARASRDEQASGAARPAYLIEEAKGLAGGNVNPQLIRASLVRRLSPLLR